MDIKVKTSGYNFNYGFIAESELNSPLCTLFYNGKRIIVKTALILVSLKNDTPLTLPRNMHIRPNVKARKNHTSDLNLTIQPMSSYEMSKHGTEHYTR